MKNIVILLMTMFISSSLKAQLGDKFTYLDSTQNATINSLAYTSMLMRQNYTIDNIENIGSEIIKIIFKIKKSGYERYSWIECTFRKNKCISTTYKTPIEQLGFMFYFLAQDFNFSKDAKKLTHKELNIIGTIDYDFNLQFYSITYSRGKNLSN